MIASRWDGSGPATARPTRSSPRHALALDGLLYAGSAAFAWLLLETSDFLTHQTWAKPAIPAYLCGLLATLVLWRLFPPKRGRSATVRSPDSHSLLWARVVVAGCVTLGACLLPLAIGVAGRAMDNPDHAQSEVVVVESAAESLIDGDDPYDAVFTSAELDGRAAGIRGHFAYLPGMTLFGVPRAVWSHPLTDARVAFAAVALLAALAAVRRVGGARGLQIWQVLVMAPTGALPLSSGGDDLPVLAVCLLGLVLLRTGSRRSGVSFLLLAASLKLTAWPLLLAVAVTCLRRFRAAGALLVALPVIMLGALLLVSRGAATDLLAYPLGLTGQASPVKGATLGSAIVGMVPDDASAVWRDVVVGALLVAAVMVAEWMFRALARRPGFREEARDSVAMAAVRYALLFLCLVAFAPAARPGYLIYPINALLWTVVLRRPVLPRQQLLKGHNEISATS